MFAHVAFGFRNNFFFDLKCPHPDKQHLRKKASNIPFNESQTKVMKSMEIELHDIMKQIILGFNPPSLFMYDRSKHFLACSCFGREGSFPFLGTPQKTPPGGVENPIGPVGGAQRTLQLFQACRGPRVTPCTVFRGES